MYRMDSILHRLSLLVILVKYRTWLHCRAKALHNRFGPTFHTPSWRSDCYLFDSSPCPISGRKRDIVSLPGQAKALCIRQAPCCMQVVLLGPQAIAILGSAAGEFEHPNEYVRLEDSGWHVNIRNTGPRNRAPKPSFDPPHSFSTLSMSDRTYCPMRQVQSCLSPHCILLFSPPRAQRPPSLPFLQYRALTSFTS